MLIAYWIVAGLLAIAYLFSGGRKVLQSKDALRPMMGWVDIMPLGLVKTIGALEVLGAIGLILPPLTGIAPPLAFAAALGLVLVQVVAFVLHAVRREFRLLPLNVVLLVWAAAAAWLATAWL